MKIVIEYVVACNILQETKGFEAGLNISNPVMALIGDFPSGI